MSDNRPTIPEGVPQPPDGFDYFGNGPVSGATLKDNRDIASLSFATGKWVFEASGKSSDYRYALRRGTDLHRLNFAASNPASPDAREQTGGPREWDCWSHPDGNLVNALEGEPEDKMARLGWRKIRVREVTKPLYEQ